MKRRKRCQLCNNLTHNEMEHIKNAHDKRLCSWAKPMILCDHCLSYTHKCPICHQRYWIGSPEQVEAIVERARTPFEPQAKKQTTIVS